MVSVEFVREMARYNEWQNTALGAAAAALDSDALTRDRGAFFGSILATLNHLLWADRLWMSRLAGWEAPAGSMTENLSLCPTLACWAGDRARADGRIRLWAQRLRPANLRGDLVWYSGLQGKDIVKPIATCVTHMFNHQTHHRGQVHAMLTAAGAETAATDLVFMPEE
ncbi:putative damage-inducible protein DinB [Aliiruegeria haliotis]|uniref:Putative damage-inducible protein DinB n=2 Tax=Aliiruegeria haliotis TaxID=1280846 RepID=A0A2T0RUP0_9RHOB|nr:DinB family protein [Aliiruegeria haliotis]PRY24858.1 putative damage-inducible protein DinB [Aliiruegeria haliotis]